jgi:hypothetical protein
MVDADRFRIFLDRLRDALGVAGPFSSTVGWIPPDPLGSLVVTRIEELAVAVRRHAPKLDAVIAAHALVARHPTEIASMQQLFDEIAIATKRRVLLHLGPAKALVMRDLLGHSVPNVLALLNKARFENAYSDVIAWLMDPALAPVVAPSCLRALCVRVQQPEALRGAVDAALAERSVAVRREMTIGRDWDGTDVLDRLDIVVSGPGFVLVIENKVDAREHVDQTKRYAKWLARQSGATAGFFLTPDGETAAAGDFISLSYLDFVACLLEGPSRLRMAADEEIILAIYVKVLAAHALRRELRALMEVT